MSYVRFEKRMSHLANAGEPKKPAYVREEHLVHKMHKRSWIGEALVDNRKGKKAEMVVVRKVSGEDNGVVASVENPATTQEPVKRIGKKVVYQNYIIEFNYLGWLSYKVRIFFEPDFKAFLRNRDPFAESVAQPPFQSRISKPYNHSNQN